MTERADEMFLSKLIRCVARGDRSPSESELVEPNTVLETHCNAVPAVKPRGSLSSDTGR